MISKLIAHDRQLGGKDGYECREEEAFALLIIVATQKYRVVGIMCVSAAREIVDRGAGYESPRRESVSIGYSTSRLGSCGIRGVLL